MVLVVSAVCSYSPFEMTYKLPNALLTEIESIPVARFSKIYFGDKGTQNL